jgi:hypothetical protein
MKDSPVQSETHQAQAAAHVANGRPGHGTAGRHPTRESLDTRPGFDDPGMFGRMFPDLEPLTVDDGALRDLAAAMTDPDPGSIAGNNANVPAGFTYILKEAEQRGNGERLGPVGATIVSEVFVGLVHGDHLSYLWLKGKHWKPELPSKTPGDFTMADLLRFVRDISPVDGITTI